MSFWKLNKKGGLSKNREGQFVDRSEYDDLIRENRNLKRTFNLENIDYQLILFVESLDLNPTQKLMAQFSVSNSIFIIRKLVEDGKKGMVS